MALLVRNISLGLSEPEEMLRQRIARTLGIDEQSVRSYGIVRRSIDARKHDDIQRIYHVQVAVDGDEKRLLRHGRAGQISLISDEVAPTIEPGQQRLRNRPVIIGLGPAGLFAALLLAENGYAPIVLERGQDVPQRHKALHLYYTQGQFDPENNLLFGIGGAGAYSDGKLYSRTHDSLNSWVLQQFVRFGADGDILINAKPHIGSDKFPGICRRMVGHIIASGGEVRYGAKVTDLEMAETDGPDRQIKAVILEGDQRIETETVLLAIGHSARDTYRMLRQRGVAMAAKPFQMGVRIEHPQELINRNQYGAGAAEILPTADYFLVAKRAAGVSDRCGEDLFSFCMCPGGTVLPSNESPGEICTNGASTSRRNSRWANSGLVVTIMPQAFDHDPLSGVEYQRRWERRAYELSGSYRVPGQRAVDFMTGRISDGVVETSFPLGTSAVDLRQMLPGEIIKALTQGLPMLDRMIRGYLEQGVLTAPETRASSPVRIMRDTESRQSPAIIGLYPVGEGAGYAGGIISSATDALKSAQELIRRFAPAG